MSSHFNLRSFLTFLSRNKGYAAVNIFGMSLSLAFIILIATFLTQSYSIGDDQKNRDRIYLLATKVFEENKVYMPGHQIYLKGLVKDFPEIEAVCAVNARRPLFHKETHRGKLFSCNVLLQHFDYLRRGVPLSASTILTKSPSPGPSPKIFGQRTDSKYHLENRFRLE
jgi:hypothetical protein